MLLSYISTQDLKQIRNLVWQYAKPKTVRRYLKFCLVIIILTYTINIIVFDIPQLLHHQHTHWLIYTIAYIIAFIIISLNSKRVFKKEFLKHTKSGYYASWIDLSPNKDPQAAFIANMKQHPELLELYNQDKGELYLSKKPGDNGYDINKDPIFKNLLSNSVLTRPQFKRYESFINTNQYYIFVICVPRTKKQIANTYQYLIFQKSKWNQGALNPYLKAIKQITDNYYNLENK